MNESSRKWVVGIFLSVLFILCIVFVVVGQRNIGLGGLLTQMAGVIGLVFLLWLYNRKYK